MKNPIHFATKQIGVNYKGTYNTDCSGSNIDTSSKLLIGSINTHPKCRISLFQRPFGTVPYLGRGSCCPILEAQIQQGDYINNRKSVNSLMETSYMPYSTIPMIPSVQKDIDNPRNYIEELADPTFIRGGLDTRDLTRDRDYSMNHTPNQYA